VARFLLAHREPAGTPLARDLEGSEERPPMDVLLHDDGRQAYDRGDVLRRQ